MVRFQELALTDEKLYEVLDGYEEYLEGLLRAYEGDEENFPRLKHLLEMVPKMRVFVQEGRREKVMRWLGFMQGVFWSLDLFSLDDLMRHNMPPEGR